MKNEKKKLGVVVGRFQTPYLHSGHRHLIDTALNESDDLLILVGEHAGWASGNDPLDYPTRDIMLRSAYPKAKTIAIKDHISDEVWSEMLDRLVTDNFPEHEPLLFGSRDSFIPYYSGKLPTREVTPKSGISATTLREQATARIPDSPDFREGVMYAHTKQNYPTAFPTVDISIMHSTEPKVLIGRKAGHSKWGFPGGFVDPTDDSFESAMRREMREEVGDIEISPLVYIGSARIDDPRYRKSIHKIMTAFFKTTYVFGVIKASDDLEEVRWQDLDGLLEVLQPEHHVLAEMLLANLRKEKTEPQKTSSDEY